MGNDNFRGNQKMKAGLLSLQHARQSTQKGTNGFINLHRFPSPTGEPIATIGIKFSLPESANAVFCEYLKLDRPAT